MSKLFDKLEEVARIVDRDKPVLHFFGLVHAIDAIDRWDLLVSSDQLAPWSMEALKYIADLLKKKLRSEEVINIAHRGAAAQ